MLLLENLQSCCNNPVLILARIVCISDQHPEAKGVAY